ncbi:MAG: hypothetical protein AABW52_03105 [Nanoarchaeota archaeon]
MVGYTDLQDKIFWACSWYDRLERKDPEHYLLSIIKVEGNNIYSGRRFDSKYPHNRNDELSRMNALESYIADIRAAIETEKQLRRMQKRKLERIAA